LYHRWFSRSKEDGEMTPSADERTAKMPIRAATEDCQAPIFSNLHKTKAMMAL
jgi:hypothetical protein